MDAPFFGPDAWAPLASALSAFMAGDEEAVLTVHADEWESDPMPVSLFFRSLTELREVDLAALDLVRGRVLDVGAGVGSLSLILQDRGAEVTAVEVVPEACDIMVVRGVKDTRLGRVEDLPRNPDFDTQLLLMNGAALAGTLLGFPHLLHCLGDLLAPGGQILLESTDILGRVRAQSTGWSEGEGDYPGELQYQMEFRGQRGAPFPQLFIDPGTLEGVVTADGWGMELVWSGEDGGFLARLMRA